MDENLKKVISSSTFEIVQGSFAYTKVGKVPESEHFLVMRDRNEITVVTEETKLAELDLIERNKESYVLICLNVSLPFYTVGFLSAITDTIAKLGTNVLVVSTYSKDYILIRIEVLEKVTEALKTLGLKKV